MNRVLKYIVSFFVVSFCLFFLLLGIIGPTGYLYNRSLTKILYSIQYNTNKAVYELDELLKYQKFLSSDEALRDNAISLGYYVKGDNVFLISNGSLQEEVEIPDQTFNFKPFKTFDSLHCFIYSITASFVINIIVFVATISKSEDSRTESSLDEDLIEVENDN